MPWFRLVDAEFESETPSQDNLLKGVHNRNCRTCLVKQLTTQLKRTSWVVVRPFLPNWLEVMDWLGEYTACVPRAGTPADGRRPWLRVHDGADIGDTARVESGPTVGDVRMI